MKISRRSTFVLLGGGALTLGSGITFVATLSDEQLVHAILERHLGQVKISNEDISAFLSDFIKRAPWLFPSERLSTLYGVAEQLKISDIVRKNLPGSRGSEIERFERHLLGEFYIKTDFYFRSSDNDPVRYLGLTACLNPFAIFI